MFQFPGLLHGNTVNSNGQRLSLFPARSVHPHLNSGVCMKNNCSLTPWLNKTIIYTKKSNSRIPKTSKFDLSTCWEKMFFWIFSIKACKIFVPDFVSKRNTSRLYWELQRHFQWHRGWIYGPRIHLAFPQKQAVWKAIQNQRWSPRTK